MIRSIGGGSGAGSSDLIKLGRATNLQLTTATVTDITFPTGSTQFSASAGFFSWSGGGAHPERITVTADCVAEVIGQIQYDANGTGDRLVCLSQYSSGDVLKDYAQGSTKGISTGGGLDTIVQGAARFNCVAGDYIVMSGYQSSGGNLNAKGAAGAVTTSLSVKAN